MEALGIDLKWFIFQLINFIVLMIGLNHLLHKPILELLDSRRQEKEANQKLASELQASASKTVEKQEELLAETRAEARKILEQTKEQAKQLEVNLQKSAQEKADQLIERAKAEIETERQELKHELRQEVAGLVITATEKILSTSAKDREKEIEEVISQLG